MKLSIGFLTRVELRTLGTEGRLIGLRDQRSRRSPPKMRTMGLRLSVQASPIFSVGEAVAMAVDFFFGQGAPSAIHFSRRAISFVLSFSFGGISRSGFLCRTAWRSRLSFGLPGMSEG